MKPYKNLMCTLLMLFPFLYIAPFHSFFTWMARKQHELSTINKYFDQTSTHYAFLIYIQYLFNGFVSDIDFLLIILCILSNRSI